MSKHPRRTCVVTGLCELLGFLWQMLLFLVTAGKMGFGLERLLSPARARSWLLGLSFYRLEPLVHDTVFYAGSKSGQQQAL